MVLLTALMLPAVAVATAPPAAATTGAVTEITARGAVLTGVVDPKGQDTDYWFVYTPQGVDGAAVDDEGSVAPVPSGVLSGAAGASTVSVAISGLLPASIYHVELQARNNSGDVSGGDVTFATQPVAPIIGWPSSASDVTDTSATLGTSLAVFGAPAWYRYDYGTTASYGQVAPAEYPLEPLPTCLVPALASSPDFRARADCADTAQREAYATLMDLTPGTIYHFRVVAHNVVGQTVGPDTTFATTGTAPTLTAPPPTSPGVAVVPQLEILSRSTTVSRAGATALTVICAGTRGRCHGRLVLAVTRHGTKGRARVVTLARVRVSLRADARAQIPLTLDPAGLRLLDQAPHRRLRVRASAGASGSVVVLAAARAR